jgi:hypothetical protein
MRLDLTDEERAALTKHMRKYQTALRWSLRGPFFVHLRLGNEMRMVGVQPEI